MKMKKKAALCLALMLVLLPTLVLGEALYGIVHGGGLKLRSGPGGNYSVLATYPTGSWVTILGENNGFYQVVTEDEGKGYMAMEYLTTDDGKLGTWATIENGNKYVNLRSGPSTNSEIIGRIYTGNRVEVLDYGTIFARCRVNGDMLCYISNGLLRMDGQIVWEELTVHSKNGGPVHLRKAPTLDGHIIDTIRVGTTVTVLIAGRNWHKVVVNGEVGYMAAEFLDVNTRSGWSVGSTAGVPIGSGAKPMANSGTPIGSGANPEATSGNPALVTGPGLVEGETGGDTGTPIGGGAQ